MGRALGTLSTIGGLAAIVLAVWWLRRPASPLDAEEAPPPFVLPVTLADVVRETVQPRVALTGTVRSPARAQLSFEVDGVLSELLVREVDRISAGQVLARLYSADEELAVALSEADVALVQRELDKLEAGTREEEKQRLAAEVAEREADEALARTELERANRLLTERVVSEADRDRREAELAAATARKVAKAAQLAEAEAGTRPEDIAIAQARVAQSQARLAVARQELVKVGLLAPRDLVVLRRLASVGDFLAVGDPVLEVVDLADLQVEVQIPGRYAVDMEEEPRVVLTLDDLPGFRLETVLHARVPAADERSRNFAGLVRLDADDPHTVVLQPGMFVRAVVSLRPRQDVLVVPADAVQRTPEGALVVRAASGPSGPRGASLVAQLVPVRVLAVEGARAAIEARDETLDPPLAAGDRVVVVGLDRAFPGAPLLPPEGAHGGGHAEVEGGSP